MTPQCRQILELMERDGAVTQLTAIHYGVMALTRRIADLRQLGFDIETETRIDLNGKRYGSYKLSGRMAA